MREAVAQFKSRCLFRLAIPVHFVEAPSGLIIPDGRGGHRLVLLRPIELIYKKNGESSKSYGDLFREELTYKDRKNIR